MNQLCHLFSCLITSIIKTWSRGQQVSHQKWISGNIHHICLGQVWIRLPTLALKPRGDITISSKQGYKRTCVHQKFKIKQTNKQKIHGRHCNQLFLHLTPHYLHRKSWVSLEANHRPWPLIFRSDWRNENGHDLQSGLLFIRLLMERNCCSFPSMHFDISSNYVASLLPVRPALHLRQLARSQLHLWIERKLKLTWTWVQIKTT